MNDAEYSRVSSKGYSIVWKGECFSSLFVKFNSSIDQKLANNLKTTLQTFFDNRKKNDCYVKMSEVGSTEFAYDFTPIVDYRMEGII
jgi:hypothetical protein